jgi:glycosyltransferase involved in cell wall biosynthesis
MQKKGYKISVVIPAYNEEGNIARCLQALEDQSTSLVFEVIVVNNNSTDKTVAIAEGFSKKLNLTILHEKKKGRSPARKLGFDTAKGNIIFSTDADACVPPNWVDSLIPHFEDTKTVAVSGTCCINDCSKRINMCFNTLQPLSMIVYKIFLGHYWLSGFNFAIRKDVYIKSGGFNPSLNSQEDTELAMRVSKLGYIKFVKTPVVLFDGRRFKNGLIRGLYPYLKSYITYFVFKNKTDTYLSDIR